MAASFPVGTVGHTLMAMRGVWHDHVEVFDLAGRALSHDNDSGTPGSVPFDNLVYIDFQGTEFRQTNVCFRGRPVQVKTFGGALRDGVLVFDPLGPDAPEHIATAAGPGVLFIGPRIVTDAWRRYHEPDCVCLHGPSHRTRTTLLYRDGKAVRTLHAKGVRLAPTAETRVPWDPRGPEGAVHALPHETTMFRRPS